MTGQDQENIIERLEAEFPAVSGSAFATAHKEALDAGNSVLQSEQGCIYEVFPDGRRILVKTIDPPTANVPGRRITIR
jgi:hypothetical protein